MWLFNGESFVKKVSGFGDLSKWEEVTEEFKTQWESEHPVEMPEWLKITKIIVSVMKKILVLLKSFYNWLNTDGLLHISFTSMIIIFSFPLIKWWSVGLAVLVGIAKEVYDIIVKKSDPKLSIHDLICDCIGIIMTVVIILVGYAG